MIYLKFIKFFRLCEKTGVISENISRELNLEPRFPINRVIIQPETGNYLSNNIYGSLRIKFNLIKDNYFRFENNNIFSYVHVSLSTSILGGLQECKTIKGIESINIPPRSQDGDVLKFEKKVIKKI